MIGHEEIEFEGACIVRNHGVVDSIGVDGYAFGFADGEPVLGAYAALLKIPAEDLVKARGDVRDLELIPLAFEIAKMAWKKWRAACESTWHEPGIRHAHEQFFPREVVPLRCPNCGAAPES